MRKMLKLILHLNVRLPAPLRVVVRVLYRAGVYLCEISQAVYAAAVVKPVMQALAVGGRRLRIERIPYIRGQGRIELGNDVYISGLLGVSFLKREEQMTEDGGQRTEDKIPPRHPPPSTLHRPLSTVHSPRSTFHVPRLTIGHRTFIGHQCSFALSGAIEIGEDCMIAAGTKIQDNDGHPLDPDARKRRERVDIGDIRPVLIGNNVWIAPRCTILKGVAIGDNAVVATGSVVTRDVPANTLVAGVPARVVRTLESGL